MSPSNFAAHSPRTIGIFYSPQSHPHPYPRSPPVPRHSTSSSFPHSSKGGVSTKLLSAFRRRGVLSSPFPHRIGWQSKKRQGLALGIVNGHPELVPIIQQATLTHPAPQDMFSSPPTVSAPSTFLPTSPMATTVMSSTSEAAAPSSTIFDGLSLAATPTPNILPVDGPNFGAYNPGESAAMSSVASSTLPEHGNYSAHAGSSATRTHQFYVALVLGILAALACIVAILAFLIRQRTRHRRNVKIRVPWDAGSSTWSHSKPPVSTMDEEAVWEDYEKRGGVGEPKHSASAYASSPSSFFRVSPSQFPGQESAGANLAGVGVGHIQLILPKLPTPIPTTAPFVDIALSPIPACRTPLPRPPLEHNGTLTPVPTTTGDLKVTNYVKGDGASVSSSATTPSTTPQQPKRAAPLEGLPTPYDILLPPAETMRLTDLGLATPEPAALALKPVSWDRNVFGTPQAASQANAIPTSSCIIDRLRAARHSATLTSPSRNTWSDGWRAALSLVSPYIYSGNSVDQHENLTPIPKRVRRGKNEIGQDGFIGGDLVGLSTEVPSARVCKAYAPKVFKVGKLSRSSTRSSFKDTGSVVSGLGIYGIDKPVFTLSGDCSDEERRDQPHPVKRSSRVKGPRSSRI